MSFPFDFIGEDEMTELSNAANKAMLLQRVDGFGSRKPTSRLDSINLTNQGAGYESVPTVAISGGSGSGAAATAVLGSNGSIKSIVVTGSSGLDTNDTLAVTIPAPTGSGGVQATATATIDSATSITVTITEAGSGYSGTVTATITGSSTGTVGTITVTIGYVLASVNVTAAGSGYPEDGVTVTFSGGTPSTAATATAVMISGPIITKAINGVGAEQNTGGDVFGMQPLISSIGVAIGGSVIDLELLKGGADMPKPAQGSFTVAGDIIVNASVKNGMELIHRNITQDRNPTSAYAGGGSFPAVHTVVSSAALNNVKATHTVVDIPAAVKYEVDPEVTLSSSPALAAGKLEGVVTIVGEDRNSIEITRVARWNSSNIATLTSQKIGGFFRKITSVSSEGFSAGNVVVDVEDKATKITYIPYDKAIVDYLDLELAIGNTVPFGFFSGVANGVGFNFGRDEAVQYTLGCLFGKVGIRENLNGGTDISVLPTGVQTADPEVFVGTQCEVEVAGVSIPLDSAALNMSQSYVPSPYIGKTLWPKKPRRSGYRSLNLVLNFPATEENEWLRYFQAHAEFDTVIVRAKNGVEGTNGQFGGIIEWSFDQLVLSEAPTISTGGQDVASQTATLMPFSNDENAAFNIVSIQQDYPERLYRYA